MGAGCSCRYQDDLDRRPALMDRVGEFQAVHAAGHLDVSEHQRDVGSALEDCDGFVGVHRLNRGIAGIFDHIDRAHPQQHFVFDDENDCGNNGVIEGHHDRRFRT